MKDKCVDCENTYNPKNDYCRRCEFEEAKWEFIDELSKTKVYGFMIKILDWLTKILRKGGVE